MLTKKEIYILLGQCGFLKNETTIVDDAALVLYGIRPIANTVDIIVSPEYLKCILEKKRNHIQLIDNNRIVFDNKIINILLNYPKVECRTINGYNVQTISSILSLKSKMDSDEALEDVESIKTYLKTRGL